MAAIDVFPGSRPGGVSALNQSFTSRCPWPCGLYAFPCVADASETFRFNPTLFERDTLFVRAFRRCKNVLGGMNSIEEWSLGDNRPVARLRTFHHPKTHYEDPRAWLLRGERWLSCCAFEVPAKTCWSGDHQLLLRLSDASVYHPEGFGNGTSLWGNRRCERNWSWFEFDGHPACVYTTAPHCVGLWSSDFKTLQTYVTDGRSWRYGAPRGGSPPVLVDGLYWCFFHSSTPLPDKPLHRKHRRYHMGAYAFRSEPPFSVAWFTPEPLLSGHADDGTRDGLPECVFPGGANYVADTWRVVLGINDLAAGWVDIPHGDLLTH